MVISWSKRLGPQLPGFSHRRLSIIFSKPPAVRDAMREQYDGRPLPYTAAMGLPELRGTV